MSHAADYFNDTTRESWSNALKYMAESARAYHWAKTHPKTKKPAVWAVYRAVHMGLLEPKRFVTDVVMYKGRRDKRAKAYQEFMEEHDGAEILTPAEYEQVMYMVESGLCHPIAGQLITAPGPTEHAVHWTDPSTNIECKGLLDKYANQNQVVDVKCSTPADFHRFNWAIGRYKYFGQIGAYEIMSGVTEESIIIAVESAPPYDVQVVKMGAWSELGQDLFRSCLDKVAEYRATGAAPGKYPETVESVPPDWMFKEEADDLIYE
jgi:hypothetical protein